MTDQKARDTFNKLNFLFSILLPLLDQAQETTRPMRGVKFTLNQFRKEVEKEYEFFFNLYLKSAPVEQEDGVMINAIDVWKVSEEAYDFLFDLIFNKDASQLVNLMHFYKQAKNKGFDENKISFQYKPVKI